MTKPYQEENFLTPIWNFLPSLTKTLSIIGFVILFFTTLSTALGSSGSTGYEFEKDLIRADNYTVGPQESKVKFFYFLDLQCPACRSFHPTLTTIKSQYSDRVQFIYKNNPLDSIHIFAKEAAKGAHAAQKQGKYVEFIDAIYERQDELGNSLMEEIALDLSLDINQWKLDKRNRDIEKLIEFDQRDLNQSFFPTSSVTDATKPTGEPSGTPTIVIMKDGEVVDWWSGGQSLEQVTAILDKHLAEQI
ncbi:MAG: thioredoxin domain-containing protein [Thermales bacterium]|nr:thioredoxin domain-containing protein [Thermales bacterium]